MRVRCCRLFGLFATCWTPLACMEIRGTGPNRVRELESSDQELVFPIPQKSFDRLPLPVLRPSRIPDGDSRASPSQADAGSPVVLLLRRQRPGDARHSVGQRNCNEPSSAIARRILASQGSVVVRHVGRSVPYDRHRARDQKRRLRRAGPSAISCPAWACPAFSMRRTVAPAPKALHRRCEACSESQ